MDVNEQRAHRPTPTIDTAKNARTLMTGVTGTPRRSPSTRNVHLSSCLYPGLCVSSSW